MTKSERAKRKSRISMMYHLGMKTADIAAALGVSSSVVSGDRPRSLKIRESKRLSNKIDQLHVPEESWGISVNRGNK
jgi:predicted transcriptional regulator